MGRWSQARHRGRGNASAPVLPSPPAPPSGDVWTLTADAFAHFFVTITALSCPVGADGFDVDVVDDDDPGITGVYQVAGCGFPLETAAGAGDHIHVRIRWTLDLSPVSDWSDTKSVVT